MTAWLLALALRLHPSLTAARALPAVEAIAAVTSDRDEARELLALEFLETSFRARDSRGHVLTPFGATEFARRHPGRHPLVDYARAALASLVAARRACGVDVARRMGFYRVGACVVDGEARRRARVVRRLR